MTEAIMQEKLKEFVRSHPAVCDICGATGNLAVGSTSRESLTPSIRCSAHMDGLQKVFAVGVEVAIEGKGADGIVRMAQAAAIPANRGFQFSDGLSKPARDDAAWFLANPTRTHRVRRAFRNEVPGVKPRDGAMIVRQVEPGKRVRRWVNPNAQIPDDDNVIGVIFNMPTIKVNVADAISRARRMALLGGMA